MELNGEERELAERYGLDEAQLRWRRWCIAANCGGDEELFAEEYPACAEEAFLSSGRPVFAQRELNRALAGAPEPRRGMLVEAGGVPRFVEGEGRYLYLYHEPVAGRDYVIGADVAAGLTNGDYSALCVIDRDTRCVAAMWHGHLDPDLLSAELERLARYFNRALVAPELNNHGIAVLYGLKRLHYTRIWRREQGDEGFLTTARSKPEAIARLAGFIREGADRLRDRGLMQECMYYAYDEAGHTNAQAGQHDDRVMAMAIALAAAGDIGTFRCPEPDWGCIYGANSRTGY